MEMTLQAINAMNSFRNKVGCGDDKDSWVRNREKFEMERG